MDKTFITDYVTLLINNATDKQLNQWSLYYNSATKQKDDPNLTKDDLMRASSAYLNHLFNSFLSDVELEVLFNDYQRIKSL